MMKSLLAGVAAIAMVVSAAAQTMDGTASSNDNNDATEDFAYECSVTKVTPPDQDKDPGYKINVYFHDDNGKPFFTRVIHTTRSGAQYSRVNQYTLAGNVINKNGANVWFGDSIKNPSIYMVGTFGSTKDGKLVYIEDLWNRKNKKMVMAVNSVCHRV
jgi:hypothetical protein